MTRVFALLAVFIPTVALALAEDQSQRNKSEESDSFDVKPPVLKQNLLNDPSSPAAAGDAVARLEKNVEGAKADAWNTSAESAFFRKWKWSNAY